MAEQNQMSPIPEAEEEVPWTAAASDNIHSFRRVDGVTQIRFKNRKGEMTGEYHYATIPEELFENMRIADSIGEFFHRNIRAHPDDYPGVKQPPPVPQE